MYQKVSLIQRCPLFSVSFIRGSTVYTQVSSVQFPRLKEVDDVLGGQAAWENVDTTEGIIFTVPSAPRHCGLMPCSNQVLSHNSNTLLDYRPTATIKATPLLKCTTMQACYWDVQLFNWMPGCFIASSSPSQKNAPNVSTQRPTFFRCRHDRPTNQ